MAVLLLCSLAAGSASAETQPDPISGQLDDPVLREYFVDLLRLSGEGYRSTERGAFIVLEPTGALRCVVWPFHNGFQREQFRGRIPDGTIAIAHTHPRDVPQPSVNDQKEAKRLGLPFVVVSPRNIYQIGADGKTVPVIRNQPWARSIARDRNRCEDFVDLTASANERPKPSDPTR